MLTRAILEIVNTAMEADTLEMPSVTIEFKNRGDTVRFQYHVQSEILPEHHTLINPNGGFIFHGVKVEIK